VLKTVERALIRKAKRGDAASIERLVRTHQEPLFAFMLRLSGRPDVAEDMVQEAFVRVLRNLDRFDDRFRFSTWLFTIARRLYVNHLQKHRPSYDSDTVGDWQGGSQRPDELTAAIEHREHVRQLLDVALECLNPQQREIVLLFHQQNWPIQDIAAHLAMPEGTIKSHLHRARKRMQEEICRDRVTRGRALESWGVAHLDDERDAEAALLAGHEDRQTGADDRQDGSVARGAGFGSRSEVHGEFGAL
jgi:RNA polymerase sigma-70 factor (ECF subfamily)